MPHLNAEKPAVEFFLDIEPGKKFYLTQPNISRRQEAQKGPTCWYYAFNYLRIRYGRDHPDCPERRIEQCISNSRKRLTESARRYSLFSSMARREVEMGKSSDYEALKVAPPFKDVQAYVSFQEKHDMLDIFLDLNKALQPTFRAKHRAITHDNINSLLLFYHNEAIRQVIHAYGLSLDQAKCHTRFDAILDLLKSHGPIACTGKIGLRYYTNRLGYQQSFHSGHKVKFFNNSYYTSEPKCKHMVVLVGAKRFTDGREYLFYIDPTTSADEPHLQAITFEDFTKQVTETLPGYYLVLPHPDYNKAKIKQPRISPK